MRDIAAAADVSAPLLIRHYGSKDGLIEAVDEYVVATFEVLLATTTEQTGAAGLNQAAVPGLLEALAVHLPPDSAIPAYLSRMLITGGAAGSALFERLFRLSQDTLDAMVAAGTATAGSDSAVRAAFLLLNDLAVLTLRPRLIEVLGVDPLSGIGMRRWAGEVFAIYRDGLVST